MRAIAVLLCQILNPVLTVKNMVTSRNSSSTSTIHNLFPGKI